MTWIYWTAAAIAWALSAWFIIAAIVEVARGKSKPWSGDVLIGVLFHGFTALLALWLANMANHGGQG